MSSGGAIWRSFADLESAGATADAVSYLEDLSALAPVRAGKERAYELLDLRPGARVLDVGSGSGHDTIALARRVAPDGQALGIDPSPTAVATAQRRAADQDVQAQFVVGDALALELDDASFDACLCDRTLQHLGDPQMGLHEIARVLRAGGTVVISETMMAVVAGEGDDDELPHRVARALHAREDHQAWIGFMVPLLLTRAGFVLVDSERVTGSVADEAELVAAYGLDRLGESVVRDGLLSSNDLHDLRSLLGDPARCTIRIDFTTSLFVGRSQAPSNPRTM